MKLSIEAIKTSVALTTNRLQLSWLQGVKMPGEAAHGDKDYADLWAKRIKIHQTSACVEFSKKHVPGSARLGMHLLSEAQWDQMRICNTAMIQFEPEKPGSDFCVGFQPQFLYHTLQECWIANSSFLSASLWENFANYKAVGGATVYFCLSNQYRSNIKHCTLMHGTLLTKPDEPADGPRQFLEVNYNPNMVEGLDTKVVKRAFGNALRNQPLNRSPIGPIEQLMAGAVLHPSLANADLVWGGSLDAKEPLVSYWPEASSKNGNLRPICLEGALVFKLNADQHARLLALLAFMNTSYEAGYMVTNNAHDDANSCLRTTIRALLTALVGERHNDFGCLWPTDILLENIAKEATQCLWLDDGEKKSAAVHSITDMDRFEDEAAIVSSDQFTTNMRSILCHPTMKTGHGGENAYNTTYMSVPCLPHRSPEALALYRMDAELALNLLMERAYDVEGH